ncbi:MAG TPA: hypothetical protein VGB24_23625 [Longimicrobium sp.]|uniref:hypothetical protein n=1 Tax=Longimicrobium sp. TaxID=2029185 RepID=UPI002EDA333F
MSTRGFGADSTHVSASFYSLDGGDRIHFRSDTLRVQNVVAKGVSGQSAVFFARVPLDSAAVAGGLRVRLPVPTLGAVPQSEFTVFSMARGGSASVTLRSGQDLVLPIIRGSSGTLPAPEYEHWNVSFYRGGKGTSISGTGPIPSPVVVPWVLIPKEGSDTMKVLVSSDRQFRFDAPPASPRLVTNIRADALLEWSVQLVP